MRLNRARMKLKLSKAEAANTPSGPPPIPKKISTLYLLLHTNNAPEISPSLINFNLTFKAFSSSIFFLCLGLSNMHTVNYSGFLFLASAKFSIFFFIE